MSLLFLHNRKLAAILFAASIFLIQAAEPLHQITEHVGQSIHQTNEHGHGDHAESRISQNLPVMGDICVLCATLDQLRLHRLENRDRAQLTPPTAIIIASRIASLAARPAYRTAHARAPPASVRNGLRTFV